MQSQPSGPPTPLVRLWRAIVKYFNRMSLESLCLELGVETDILGQGTRPDKVRSLINYMDRHGLIHHLINTLSRVQPEIDWKSYLTGSHYLPDDSPYPGLLPFEETDSSLFFGRQKETAQLVGKIRDSNFVALVGSSGSGKSSLVNAGFIPAMKTERLLADGSRSPSGSSAWAYFTLSPKADPLYKLALVLNEQAPPEQTVSDVRKKLESDPASVGPYFDLLLTRLNRSCALLIADQFEELFTLTSDEAIRLAFVNALLNLARHGDKAKVLIVLRADFYNHCSRYAELAAVLSRSQLYLTPMNREGFRQAIEGPAELHGLKLESGLVELMLHDAGIGQGQLPQPGALPLLAHALRETWNNRPLMAVTPTPPGQMQPVQEARAPILTHHAYQTAGGVAGALRNTAERVYCGLSDVQQGIVRRMFTLRLAVWQEDVGKYMRRRATEAELSPTETQKQATLQVLSILTQARLVTREMDDKGPVVDMAHEVLLTTWPALQTWLNEYRQQAILLQRISRDADDWAASERDEAYLYWGSQLQGARALLTQDVFSAREREFVEAGAAAEARETRSGRIRRRALVLVALLVITLAASLLVLFQRSQSVWSRLYGEAGVLTLAAAGPEPYFGTLTGQVGRLTATGPLIFAPPLHTSADDDDEVWAVDYLAWDPQQPARLYAAVRANGVYWTADGGESWQPPGSGLPHMVVKEVAASANQVATILYPENTLYLSQDGGQSWQTGGASCAAADSGGYAAPDDVFAIAFVGFAGQEPTLYVGASDGLYQVETDESCWHWERLVDLQRVYQIAVGPENSFYLADNPDQQGSKHDLYRWTPGHAQALTKLATFDYGLFSLAANPDVAADYFLFALLSDGTVVAMGADGPQPLARHSRFGNELLAYQDTAGAVHLLLADDDGLLRFREPLR